MVVSGNGSISYSDYNEGSLNRSIYPSTDRPSPPVIKDPAISLTGISLIINSKGLVVIPS